MNIGKIKDTTKRQMNIGKIKDTTKRLKDENNSIER